jgi:hypothetical protein
MADRRGGRARAAAFAMAAAAAVLAAGGCAERRAPTEIEAHPGAWSEPASPDFHGARVERADPSGCVPCHGADFRGGARVPGCYDCHDGPGGHPGRWASRDAARFHGEPVEKAGPAACGSCHGPDYRGGWSGVSCYTCHAGGPSGHPDGWMNRASSSFHGLKVFTQGVEDCTRCHGFGLGGGTSRVACAKCHG